MDFLVSSLAEHYPPGKLLAFLHCSLEFTEISTDAITASMKPQEESSETKTGVGEAGTWDGYQCGKCGQEFK